MTFNPNESLTPLFRSDSLDGRPSREQMQQRILKIDALTNGYKLVEDYEERRQLSEERQILQFEVDHLDSAENQDFWNQMNGQID